MREMNSQENDGPHYLIIPAAGLGTRMRTVNADLPKELLPVGSKPAIQYSVEEGLSAGIENIIIVISKEKEIIRQYFEDREVRERLYPRTHRSVEEIRSKCSLTFLYQKELRGESDAISCAKDIAGNHAAAIIYPDNLYMPAPGALNILKPVFNTYKKDVIALNEVSGNMSHTISNAGKVDITHFKDHISCIQKFHQKSESHFTLRFEREFRACGVYITAPHVFEYIEKIRATVHEGEITDTPVRSLILKEKGMLGCKLPGIVHDIGNPGGYEFCLEKIKGKATFGN